MPVQSTKLSWLPPVALALSTTCLRVLWCHAHGEVSGDGTPLFDYHLVAIAGGAYGLHVYAGSERMPVHKVGVGLALILLAAQWSDLALPSGLWLRIILSALNGAALMCAVRMVGSRQLVTLCLLPLAIATG